MFVRAVAISLHGQMIITVDVSNVGDRGRLAWNGDWVSFLDTMLQLQILSEPSRALRLPTRIRSLAVHPGRHLAAVGAGDKPAGKTLASADG
jgi:hypothetical protein